MQHKRQAVYFKRPVHVHKSYCLSTFASIIAPTFAAGFKENESRCFSSAALLQHALPIGTLQCTTAQLNAPHTPNGQLNC